MIDCLDVLCLVVNHERFLSEYITRHHCSKLLKAVVVRSVQSLSIVNFFLSPSTSLDSS